MKTYTGRPLIVVTKGTIRIVGREEVMDDLRAWKKLNRVLTNNESDAIGRGPDRGAVVITGPRFKVITSTKCAENITMK